MGKVIAFLGSDGRCGLSQTALSVSFYLSKMGKKVLLSHFEGKHGGDYLRPLGENLRRLRPYLKEGLWDKNEVMSRAVYEGNLSIIGGADDPISGGDYMPEYIESLLYSLKDSYDFIICDCGHDLCHGAAVGALEGSGEIYMVLGQSENYLKQYEKMKPVLKRLKALPSLFIIGGFDPDHPEDEEYIAKRINVSKGKVIAIPFASEGRDAEMKGRALWSYGNRKYERSIKSFAEVMMKNGL